MGNGIFVNLELLLQAGNLFCLHYPTDDDKETKILLKTISKFAALFAQPASQPKINSQLN